MKFEGLVQDDTQNYVLENEGYQNLTHTVITFRRALETCDPRDVPLTVRRSLFKIMFNRHIACLEHDLIGCFVIFENFNDIHIISNQLFKLNVITYFFPERYNENILGFW